MSDTLFFFVCYSILYILASTVMLPYIVLQVRGKDYKKVDDSLLTILLGSYEASNLRGWRGYL